MKNEKMVRTYTGNYFWFDREKTMYTFIKLYKDMWLDYIFIEGENECILKVICKKGVIPSMKECLKDYMVTKGHNRYYVKAS